MSAEDRIDAAAYYGNFAEAAVYQDRSGERFDVRIIRERDTDSALNAEIAVQATRLAFRVRKSDVPDRPRAAEQFEVAGVEYRVDDVIDFNVSEWWVYVLA